jgi:hypothetical protein
MKKRFFMAVLVFAALLAYGQSPDDFEVFQNEDGESLTIRKYNGLLRDVNIPAELYGLPVTAIGGRAFENMAIVGVVIPNGVVSIGDFAFSGNRLTSVDIPDSVTTIEYCAFNRNQLTRLTLGNGLSDIGDNAFSQNKLTSVVIPNSVTKIGWSAFALNQLTSVDIPDSVISIESGAFRDNQLTSITLGSGLLVLMGEVFSRNQLTSITIARDVPEGLVTIDPVEHRILSQSGISTAAGFEEGFVNYYRGQNRAPGTYVKNGPIWSKR